MLLSRHLEQNHFSAKWMLVCEYPSCFMMPIPRKSGATLESLFRENGRMTETWKLQACSNDEGTMLLALGLSEDI